MSGGILSPKLDLNSASLLATMAAVMVKARLVSVWFILGAELSSNLLLGNSGSCSTAFHQPNDNQVQVQCEDDNVRNYSF